MREGLENIDRLFRENLNDYSQTPPVEVWNRIEQSLVKNRKRIIFPLYFKIAASILFLAGLTALVWKFTDTTDNKVITEVTRVNKAELPLEPSKEIIVVKDQKQGITAQSSNAVNPVKSEILSSSDTVKLSSAKQLQSEVPIQLTDDYVVMQPSESAIERSDTTPVIPDVAVTRNETIAEEKPINSTPVNDLIIQQNLLALENGEGTQDKRSMLWSVGGQAGPQYSYRDVYLNTSGNQVGNFNDYEKGVIAYAGGLQIELEPLNRFSIQSGVFYSKIGQVKASMQLEDLGEIGNTWDPSADGIVNSTGNFSFDKSLPAPLYSEDDPNWEPGIVTAEQYFEFIEVPLVCTYKIIDKKLDINVSSGIWADILVGNKASVTDNQNFYIQGDTENINKFNYSASVAVGFDYPVAKRLRINLQPLFKYYLAPINSNPQTEVYPYSFSLMTGVEYSF